MKIIALKSYIGGELEPWDMIDRERGSTHYDNQLTWKSWEGSISDFYCSRFYGESFLESVVHLIELSVPPVDVIDAAIFTEDFQNVQLCGERGREGGNKL